MTQFDVSLPVAARPSLDEDLLDDFAVAGTPEAARDRLVDLARIEGVDALALGFPRGADDEAIRAAMEALTP